MPRLVLCVKDGTPVFEVELTEEGMKNLLDAYESGEMKTLAGHEILSLTPAPALEEGKDEAEK